MTDKEWWKQLILLMLYITIPFFLATFLSNALEEYSYKKSTKSKCVCQVYNYLILFRNNAVKIRFGGIHN